jgi:hypothetical protein
MRVTLTGFANVVMIVGEDKFGFNNTCQHPRGNPASHELFGRWQVPCAPSHGFLLRFRQRQGRIRPRKG